MKKFLRLSRWHRWIGITVALFVLMLAISGLLLNHSDRLQLDKSYIGNELLLDWYGVQPQHAPVSHAAGDHWITQINGQLYFDGTLLADDAGKLVGAVDMGKFIVVAADHKLYLLMDNGDVIEKLGGAEGVPAGMQAIGLTSNGALVIRAAHDIYRANLDSLEWRHTAASGIRWSKAETAPAAHIDEVMRLYRGRGLSYERVLLDLHSGRILGGFGSLLIDLVAVLFCGLAVTGLIMWFRGY